MLSKETEIRRKTGLLCDTLIRKNMDYANSFEELFKKYGMTYSLIHLEEKMKRIENLVGGENSVNNESIKDSLLDLAGYAILTLISLGDDDNKDVSCNIPSMVDDDVIDALEDLRIRTKDL